MSEHPGSGSFVDLDGAEAVEDLALAPNLSSFAREAAVPLAEALVEQLPWLALAGSMGDVSQVQVKHLGCRKQFVGTGSSSPEPKSNNFYTFSPFCSKVAADEGACWKCTMPL